MGDSEKSRTVLLCGAEYSEGIFTCDQLVFVVAEGLKNHFIRVEQFVVTHWKTFHVALAMGYTYPETGWTTKHPSLLRVSRWIYASPTLQRLFSAYGRQVALPFCHCATGVIHRAQPKYWSLFDSVLVGWPSGVRPLTKAQKGDTMLAA